MYTTEEKTQRGKPVRKVAALSPTFLQLFSWCPH